MLPVHDGGLEPFNTSVLAVSSQNHLQLLSVLEDELRPKRKCLLQVNTACRPAVSLSIAAEQDEA